MFQKAIRNNPKYSMVKAYKVNQYTFIEETEFFGIYAVKQDNTELHLEALQGSSEDLQHAMVWWARYFSA